MLRHRWRVMPRLNFSSPYVDLPHRLAVIDNLRVYGRLYGMPTDAVSKFFYYNRANDSLSSGKRYRHDLEDGLRAGLICIGGLEDVMTTGPNVSPDIGFT